MSKVVRIFKDDVQHSEQAVADLPVVGGRPQVSRAALTGTPGTVFRTEFVVPNDAPFVVPDAPTNTTAPAITPTTAEIGATLTRTAGVWSGADSVEWLWLVNYAEQQTGGGTFTAVAGSIRIRETATNAGGSNSADSAAVEVVGAAVPDAATLDVANGATGQHVVTIGAPPNWNGTPGGYRYRVSGSDRVLIPHDGFGANIVLSNGATLIFGSTTTAPAVFEAGVFEAGVFAGETIAGLVFTVDFPMDLRGTNAVHEVEPELSDGVTRGPLSQVELDIAPAGPSEATFKLNAGATAGLLEMREITDPVAYGDKDVAGDNLAGPGPLFIDVEAAGELVSVDIALLPATLSFPNLGADVTLTEVTITSAAPAISSATVTPDSPRVGDTLAVAVVATGAPDPTLAYQWQRAAVAISGATADTYIAVSADDGTEITCRVTATNGVEPPAELVSNAVTILPPLVGPVLSTPTVAPTSGVEGTQFTVSYSYTNTPEPAPTVEIQWLREASEISGATAASYTAIAGDVGKTLTCRVHAANAGGTDTKTSAGVSVASATLDPLPDFTGVTGALLRVNDPDNRFKVDGGTSSTDLAVHGDVIGRLRSLVAGGYDAIQPTSANRPLLNIGADGKATARCAVGQYLQNTTLPVSSPAKTIILGGHVPSPVHATYPMGYDTYGCFLMVDNTWAWRANSGGTWVETGVPADVPAVISVVIQANGSGKLWINGVEKASWAAWPTLSHLGYALGARRADGLGSQSALNFTYLAIANEAFDDTKRQNQEAIAAADMRMTL